MLMTTLAPLLSRYSLTTQIMAGDAGMISLTIVPRRPEGNDKDIGDADLTPIQLQGTPAEIDEALGAGENGPLGSLIKARISLSDQITALKEAAVAAEAAAKAAKTTTIKASAAKSPSPVPAKPAAAAAPTPDPLANASAEDPATLW